MGESLSRPILISATFALEGFHESVVELVNLTKHKHHLYLQDACIPLDSSNGSLMWCYRRTVEKCFAFW